MRGLFVKCKANMVPSIGSPDHESVLLQVLDDPVRVRLVSPPCAEPKEGRVVVDNEPHQGPPRGRLDVHELGARLEQAIVEPDADRQPVRDVDNAGRVQANSGERLIHADRQGAFVDF